jgi:beta-glucanase (GH16 family)
MVGARALWRGWLVGGLIAPAALVAAPAAGAVVRTGSLVGRDALRSAQARTAQAVVPLDPAWSEEFDGSTLDLTRWSHRATGPRHDGILTPDAVSVGDGVLTIKTYTESGQHFSGMISTQRQGSVGFEQTYGYFEARVKFNSSPGQWSAFWLQSPTLGNPVGDPAAAGVEMDIAEHRVRCVAAPLPTPPSTCAAGNDISDRTQLALVWDGYGVDSRSAVKLSDPLAQLGNGSWHTWALRWTPTELTFYYDDDAIWSIDGPISRRSQYAVLSSEVGQFFAGAIPAAGYGSRETSTTAMQVDYVRVWASSPQGLPTAPLNTAGPVASGTPEVGQALACSPGSWTGNPAPTFGYEWIGDGAAIAGATASTYIVRSIDQGHALSCRVTATNAAGPVSALSNTLLVASAPPEAQPQTRSEPPAPPLAPLAPALPPAVIGSSSCETISLLRVTPRGPSFRVRVQPHCRGKLSLKATATALIGHPPVASTLAG